MKLQKLLSYVRRAADDYGMIGAGDRIAVGISGGKDSLTLLAALRAMQVFYPHAYELRAVTVSLGLSGFDTANVARWCGELGVPYTVIDTEIGDIVFNERKEKNPCSLCAKMRRGALNGEAAVQGCHKVALGHSMDDLIETFFLSLFYEGRIHTFRPVTYLDRKNIHTIRPLMYVPEKEIIAFARENNLPVIKSPCPADGFTKREEIKNFVKEQTARDPGFPQKIFGAIQRNSGLWA